MMKKLWPLVLLFIGCGQSHVYVWHDLESSQSGTALILGSDTSTEATDLDSTLHFSDLTELVFVQSTEPVPKDEDWTDSYLFLSSLSFTMTVENPIDSDLSFIESMEVYIEAPNLPRIPVLTQTVFDSNIVFIDNDELEDSYLLDNYYMSESLTLTADVSGSLPEQDTTVRADVQLSTSFVQSVGYQVGKGLGRHNYLLTD